MKTEGRRVSKNVSRAKPLPARTKAAVDAYAKGTGEYMGIAPKSIDELLKTGKLTHDQYTANRNEHDKEQDEDARKQFARLPKKVRDKADKDLSAGLSRTRGDIAEKKYGYKFLEPKKMKVK